MKWDEMKWNEMKWNDIYLLMKLFFDGIICRWNDMTLFLTDGAFGFADGVRRNDEASSIVGDVDGNVAERFRQRDVVPLIGVVASKLSRRTRTSKLSRTKTNAPLLRRRRNRKFFFAVGANHRRRPTHSSLKMFEFVRILCPN
jgi:hypothetical protein